MDGETTEEWKVTMELEFHEYANLFPLIEGKEFDELVEDVKAHGVREPIVLYNSKILDGRNRYRAAQAASVEYDTEEYNGDDPLGLVVSLNLKRRHLTESQRGVVAAKLATMTHGGDRKTDQDANLHVDRTTAATMLNVSTRTVADATKVINEAAPELVAAVESGKVAVSAAAQATKFMDADEQRKSVADGTLAKAVAELRRAEAKHKEAERVIAEAPKFTEDEKVKIKEMMGNPGDGDIYSRIAEIIALIEEQPDAESSADRIPDSLAHAINTKEIHAAAKWLLDFCTAWEAKRVVPSFVPAFLLKEAA